MASTASEYIRSKLKSFLSERDTSLRKVSQDTGVDYTTIHRIHSGKKRGVEFFDAIRIISYLDPENCLSSLTKFFPREIEEMANNGLAKSQTDRDIATMQYIADSKDTYDVFIFVSEGLPKKRLDVTNEFGRRGSIVLDDLIERGAVKVGPDDQLQAFSNEIIHLPTGLIKDIARLNLESIDTQSPGCLMRNLAMGLNLAGATRAYDALAEANTKLQEISRNPEYQGSLVMLFTLLCGVHSTKESSEAQP
ncbi:helix-turn-helix domain-containing protein [Oligoflexus tunisiensis]|uniref:helix-turn-helix domain-containing protein n=1 Tax=Oligoflexus tunisiensis TaxID=708132 RepID=UPI00114C9315|nr:hypothetical protein [Oligoflexus tunisiensis]